MWLHTLMLEPPMLLKAPALFAGKATVPTLQEGAGGQRLGMQWDASVFDGASGQQQQEQ